MVTVTLETACNKSWILGLGYFNETYLKRECALNTQQSMSSTITLTKWPLSLSVKLGKQLGYLKKLDKFSNLCNSLKYSSMTMTTLSNLNSNTQY